MLLASGVNFGFKKSLPHILGISIGFFILLACVGFGLGQILTNSPLAFTILKSASAIYLVYLSWAIAMSGEVQGADKSTGKKPMSFFGAVMFQWVNPKAWIMAISAYSLYVPPNASYQAILFTAGLFSIICLPCIIVWLYFGVSLKRFLSDAINLRIFNYTMAFLLLLSLFSFVGSEL